MGNNGTPFAATERSMLGRLKRALEDCVSNMSDAIDTPGRTAGGPDDVLSELIDSHRPVDPASTEAAVTLCRLRDRPHRLHLQLGW